MKESIDTFSISRLQKAFDLTLPLNAYLYIDSGKEPIYADEPFRTETYSIVWLRQGNMDLQVDLSFFRVTGPAVITIGPNMTRSFQRTAQCPDMQLFFFTGEFITETLANIFYLDRYRFFDSGGIHALMIDADETKRISSIFELIRDTFRKGHVNELSLMRNYGYLLIHEIDAIHRSRDHGQRPDEGNLLFVRFRNLLVKEFWKHRTVSFYANKLNVTPKYLSEVVKKQSGRTAGNWIDKAVLQEARVLLQNKSLSIAQISESLHFSDQSVFGKFFKGHTGCSPNDYRKDSIF